VSTIILFRYLFSNSTQSISKASQELSENEADRDFLNSEVDLLDESEINAQLQRMLEWYLDKIAKGLETRIKYRLKLD